MQSHSSNQIALIPGGYTPVTPVVLCNLLGLLNEVNEGELTFRAARCFVACLEMKAIREGAFASSIENASDRFPRYQLDELHRRVGGVGGEYI